LLGTGENRSNDERTDPEKIFQKACPLGGKIKSGRELALKVCAAAFCAALVAGIFRDRRSASK
jgi:hypothetical protein